MIVGMILAGGRSQRFGVADKAEASLGGVPLAQWVRSRAEPQVDELIVNANGPVESPVLSGLPVVADPIPGFRGPLAGILAGLEWLSARRGGKRWLASFPVDTPFFPLDLVARLCAQVQQDDLPVVAASKGRTHPAFGLWPVSLVPALRHYLMREARSAVVAFAHATGAAEVAFPAEPYDPFFNINRPEDLEAAMVLCRRFGLSVDLRTGDRGRPGQA